MSIMLIIHLMYNAMMSYYLLIKITIIIMLYRDHEKMKYVELGKSDGILAAAR